MKRFLSVLFGLTLFLGLSLDGNSQKHVPVYAQPNSEWADSLMATLSLDERIGQLFMVAAYSNKGSAHEANLKTLVENYHIGGLIFFQGGPLRQAHITNRLQAAADIPLWIGMDAEWGLSMRLDSTIKYPRQMTLGAISDDTLIYRMGAELADQMKRLGAHINFAPVVDVNNNPANPVINSRSFGEDKFNVTKKSLSYMRGMQDHGVLANAKHFPGHGDTDTDSHHALPVINHSAERLKDIELYPYSALFESGLSSVMVAHLSVPALDSTANRASTLSPEIVTDLLKGEYGFDGLVFTDALNMKGVSQFYEPGEVDLLAAKAGNDVLLFAEDVPNAVGRIKAAISSGEYSEAELNASVKKILQAKAWLGLPKAKSVDIENLHKDLNKPSYLFTKKKIAEGAITLVQNKNGIVPINLSSSGSIGLLHIGGTGQAFEEQLSAFASVSAMQIPGVPNPAQAVMAKDSLSKHKTIVVCISGTGNRPSRNFGLSDEAIQLVESLGADHQVVLAHMGNPYALAKLEHPERIDAILVGYQDDPYLAQAAAQAIMGGVPITGKLPVSVGSYFPVQTGLRISENTKMHYSTPQEMGLGENAFDEIDKIAQEGISKRAYPGAQILVAKDGHVVYNKNFGYHTYEDGNPVESSDIYDLASITKIAATTISLMKLDDEGVFDLDIPVGHYLDYIPTNSPYAGLTSRQMLAHMAGLKPWIPFYTETLEKGTPRWDIYSQAKSDVYGTQVSRQMYIKNEYRDSLRSRILMEPLRSNNDYKYSDLGYYFMMDIVEKLSGTTLDEFAAEQFYRPMGLPTMGYYPLNRFDLDRIVPTEYDTYFRMHLVHGYVHDPGAAMMGGVGGHAGVFSNAQDLAALMQMLLNKGTYGGERYLSEEVIAEYTKCQYCEDEMDENRRGAGFDKPVIPDGPGPTCKCVSFDSFGHSGFTGTIAWADPVEDIVYVFLSNRVYPSAVNNKLAKMDIRTRIQEEIYRVLATPPDTTEARATP